MPTKVIYFACMPLQLTQTQKNYKNNNLSDFPEGKTLSRVGITVSLICEQSILCRWNVGHASGVRALMFALSSTTLRVLAAVGAAVAAAVAVHAVPAVASGRA